MSTWAVPLLVGVVAAVVAWILASRSRSRHYEKMLEALSRDLREGTALPRAPDASGEPAGVRALRHAVAEEWTPRTSAPAGDATTALARFAGFLRASVADVLLQGLEGGSGPLRAWAEKVVDTVEDTEFFLEEPETRFQTGDVTRVLQEVTREFAGEFDAMVKLRAPDGPLRARLAPEAFKDAVYLVLANAAHFSRGQPVELTVEDAGGRLRIRVRDRGPGFSSEALERGTEPFFTTDEGALGLGLPHVRRIVEMHAGELHVRNREEGGGEVEIVIPRGLD